MTRQRQISRVPLRPKPAACSEANSLTRAAGDRSCKLENRRSHRTALHEQQKRRGSRVADLETKLDETMEELKKLKLLLVAEDAAKRVVQKKLEKTKNGDASSQPRMTVSSPDDAEEKEEKLSPAEKDSDSCVTTDVGDAAASYGEEIGSRMEPEAVIQESAESPEMTEVRAKLAEKEKELETVEAEKESAKIEAEEAMARSTAERKKNEEMEAKLAGAEEELRQSKATVEQMKQKLEAQESEKTSMEVEMKRLRIQTDQWRKASEAAASMLGHDSFGSENKPLETYANGWSPLIAAGADADKRRGSGGGIRVLGDLWKKRGQPK